MASMLEAFNWVKDAISTKGLQPLTLYYLIEGGMIYGTDGRMTVGHPFPSDLNFCAVAAPTLKLVERLPDPKITVKEDEVVFRSGRLSGAVKTVSPGQWQFNREVGKGFIIPDRLLPSLEQLRPFISDNAAKAWALCVLADNNSLYATNNIAVAAALEIDLHGMRRALIPNWAIDFLMHRRDGLIEWSYQEDLTATNSMTFYWDNGAWMRTQLMDDQFPTSIDDVIGRAPYCDLEITPEWKAAYAYVAGLAESHVEFHAERIVGRDGPLNESKMTATADVATPVPDNKELLYSAWDPRFLEPVMKVATHFDPRPYPAPCPFRGPDVIGVVMGRRG